MWQNFKLDSETWYVAWAKFHEKFIKHQHDSITTLDNFIVLVLVDLIVYLIETKRSIISVFRRVARNLHWGAMFWRLGKTLNDFDPDFDCSSLKLFRFSVKIRWSPKKRSSLKLRRFFCPNPGDLIKKGSLSRLHPSFCAQPLIRYFTNSHRQNRYGVGDYFRFSCKNRPQKCYKQAIWRTFQANGRAR